MSRNSGSQNMSSRENSPMILDSDPAWAELQAARQRAARSARASVDADYGYRSDDNMGVFDPSYRLPSAAASSPGNIAQSQRSSPGSPMNVSPPRDGTRQGSSPAGREQRVTSELRGRHDRSTSRGPAGSQSRQQSQVRPRGSDTLQVPLPPSYQSTQPPRRQTGTGVYSQFQASGGAAGHQNTVTQGRSGTGSSTRPPTMSGASTTAQQYVPPAYQGMRMQHDPAVGSSAQGGAVFHHYIGPGRESPPPPPFRTQREGMNKFEPDPFQTFADIQQQLKTAQENNESPLTLQNLRRKVARHSEKLGVPSPLKKRKDSPETHARKVKSDRAWNKDSVQAVANDLNLTAVAVRAMDKATRQSHVDRVRKAGLVDKLRASKSAAAAARVDKGKGKEQDKAKDKGKGKGKATAEPQQTTRVSASPPASFPAGDSWSLGGGSFQGDSSRGRTSGFLNRLPANTSPRAGARQTSPMVVSSRGSTPASQMSSRQSRQSRQSSPKTDIAKAKKAKDASDKAARKKKEAADKAALKAKTARDAEDKKARKDSQRKRLAEEKEVKKANQKAAVLRPLAPKPKSPPKPPGPSTGGKRR